MLDRLDPTTHPVAVKLAVISMPSLGILMNSNTWVVVSGIFASIYYAILIAEKSAYWIERWRGKTDGHNPSDSD